MPAYGAGLAILSVDLLGLYWGRFRIGHAAHLTGALVGVMCFLAGEGNRAAVLLVEVGDVPAPSTVGEVVLLLQS